MNITSVTISSRTKEAIIGDAIRSVEKVCSSHLLVDLYDSGDDCTLEAFRRGAEERKRVIWAHRLEGFHISHWRNFGLKKVKGDWAIMLDTDVRLAPRGYDIAGFLEKLPADIKIVAATSADGTYDKEMFFRLPVNPEEIFYKNEFHEELVYPPECACVIPVVRFWELEKTDEAARARMEKDIAGLDDQLAANPADFRSRVELANTYKALKNYHAALAQFGQAANHAPDPSLAAWCYQEKAQCRMALGEPAVAVLEALDGLSHCSWMAELYYQAALACLKCEDWQDAIGWATSAAAHGAWKGQGVRTGLRDPIALFEGPFAIQAAAFHKLKEFARAREAETNWSDARQCRLKFFGVEEVGK